MRQNAQQVLEKVQDFLRQRLLHIKECTPRHQVAITLHGQGNPLVGGKREIGFMLFTLLRRTPRRLPCLDNIQCIRRDTALHLQLPR